MVEWILSDKLKLFIIALIWLASVTLIVVYGILVLYILSITLHLSVIYAPQGKFPGFGVVEPRIELEFENLGMRLHKRAKVVLQGVSGESKFL